MNTAIIIEKCREIPGVTVNEENGYTELLLDSDDGGGRMRFFPLFPGIMLAAISVNARTWPAPRLGTGAPEAKGPFIINYCLRGRCELVLNDSRSVFLTSGHVSLTEKFAMGEYTYPGSLYEGIELFVDSELPDETAAMLGSFFNLSIPVLREMYCPDGKTFIGKMPLPEDLANRLYADATEAAGSVKMKTGVIDIMAMLQFRQKQETEQITYYTKSQVEMAKQIEAIITGDLSKQHTAREFARQFSVSESSIKNYFYGVYGESILQYAVRRRMKYASELLADTSLPVIEIAGRVGYENQSKFSAAFRKRFGSTPLEYRRSHRLSGK